MMDMLARIKLANGIEAGTIKAFSGKENAARKAASLREKWVYLKRRHLLGKGFETFEGFEEWFRTQHSEGIRFYVIWPDPRLPEGTKATPENSAIIAKGLMEYLSEFRLKETGGLPVGVRVGKRSETSVTYSFTKPAGAARVGSFRDPLECQRAWLQARIEHIESYREQHGGAPLINAIMSHYQERMRFHIDNEIEYHIGDWKKDVQR